MARRSYFDLPIDERIRDLEAKGYLVMTQASLRALVWSCMEAAREGDHWDRLLEALRRNRDATAPKTDTEEGSSHV